MYHATHTLSDIAIHINFDLIPEEMARFLFKSHLTDSP